MEVPVYAKTKSIAERGFPSAFLPPSFISEGI